MTSHPYHPSCGCFDCGELERADELAAEAREEAIERDAVPILLNLLATEDCVTDLLQGMTQEAKDSVLADVARFFARYYALPPSAAAGEFLGHARDLYLALLPDLNGRAFDQARDQAAADYDRQLQKQQENRA